MPLTDKQNFTLLKNLFILINAVTKLNLFGRAPYRGRAIRDFASLRCFALLPLVASLLSLTQAMCEPRAEELVKKYLRYFGLWHGRITSILHTSPANHKIDLRKPIAINSFSFFSSSFLFSIPAIFFLLETF